MQANKNDQHLITLHHATEADFFEIKHFLKRHKQSSANRHDKVYIVRFQKRLIGIAKLVVIPNDSAIDQYWLRGLYIEAAHRKQGLASLLLKFIDQDLTEQSIRTQVHVEIMAFPFAHLESFYLQNGYQFLKPTTLPSILKEPYQKACEQKKNWLSMHKVL